MRTVRVLLAAALLLGACVSAPALSAPSSALPSALATPTPLPRAAITFLRLLADRDAAQAAGDVSSARALVDPSVAEPYLEREVALAEATAARHGQVPARRFLELRERDGLFELQVAETDDQGRTRRLRYFARGTADALLLAEPAPRAIGAIATRDTGRAELRYTELDADQAGVTASLVESALDGLIARLGDAYQPRSKIPLDLAPLVVKDLPPFASAYVNEARVTLLTSSSMMVDREPGADWARIVVTHELSHVLLFQRGNSTFLLTEGIPLWLTDDRRQPELDRLVAANALWTLDHLVRGPSGAAEFFAGYAQAASFVRFAAARWGERAVIAAWEAGLTLRFPEAFRAGTGVDAEQAYAAWRASLGR